MTEKTPKPPKSPRAAKAKASSAAPSRLAIRNQRQAEYQRAYRAEQKLKRIPSRDDVARVALHWAITQLAENSDEGGLSRLHGGIVRQLVELGFDQGGADRRVSDLIDQYEAGWDFQSKPHLRLKPEDGASA
jgi:hypothetical protein